MAEPVLFLPPRIETEEQREHRVKLARLSGQALHEYAQRVYQFAELGTLPKPWRLQHVQEEQRRRV